MPYKAGRYAVIDIGTVTCRMLIADVLENGEIIEIDKQYTITNLGEDVDVNGYLSEAAMERTLSAVARFLNIQKEFVVGDEPITTFAFATSAARDASNSQKFVEGFERLGIDLRIITGEQEARFSFVGASSEFGHDRIMVLDIGGGSTEAVWGVAGSDPRFIHSFDMGSRRITERYLHSDPPTEPEISEARKWIREMAEPYLDSWTAQGMLIDRIVAVAGTATSVVSVRDRMETYDSSRVHKAYVSLAELEDVTDRLAKLNVAQRRNVVGLDPMRAPVIVGGMIILEEMIKSADAGGFVASESDILRGVLLKETAC